MEKPRSPSIALFLHVYLCLNTKNRTFILLGRTGDLQPKRANDLLCFADDATAHTVSATIITYSVYIVVFVASACPNEVLGIDTKEDEVQ